ncbi:hypothetical protein HII31_08938 [Pseudocercospora fuligena]|uniref:Uncharacterized protein n=1 Tax=Pseudocercospora fuligena TaxID=685502 RepID=A0A8H6RGW2_9PEZI|nr:hypothetical protein HII31_08938 [Pseudocercospora fuligena]
MLRDKFEVKGSVVAVVHTEHLAGLKNDPLFLFRRHKSQKIAAASATAMRLTRIPNIIAMPLSPSLLPCCLIWPALVLLEGWAELVVLADEVVVALDEADEADVRELDFCVVEIDVVADFEFVVALVRLSAF